MKTPQTDLTPLTRRWWCHFYNLGVISLWTAISVLTLTATAKLVSINFSEGIPLLNLEDAVLGVKTRTLMIFAATLEFCVATLLYRCGVSKSSAIALDSLIASFALYRGAFFAINPSGICPCLGNILQFFGVQRSSVNGVTTAVFGILLLTGITLTTTVAVSALSQKTIKSDK